jgi:enolase
VSKIHRSSRVRGTRFPWQPDGHGGGDLAGGASGSACAPSGASTGSREALELRDGDAGRYLGKGVSRPWPTSTAPLRDRCSAWTRWNSALSTRRCMRPRRHGEQGESRCQCHPRRVPGDGAGRRAGAPACRSTRTLPPSTGGADAMSMPVPMMNILNGGEHADNNVDIQEFMIQPVAAPSFAEALRCGAEIFHHLKKVLTARGLNTAVGDEGGFAPDLPSNEAALEVDRRGRWRRRLPPRRRRDPGPRLRRLGVLPRRALLPAGDGRDFDSAGFVEYLAELVDGIRSCPSRTASTSRTGMAGSCSRSASASACSWWVTTCSSPTRRSSPRASSAASATRS